MNMRKLMLVDGNAILHRAYHAVPQNLTSRKGTPINAVYGFTAMLLRLIEDLDPTHIAVCFDRKEPTFRHKAFKKYQSQRPAMENNLSVQFTEAKDVIGSFGICIFEKAGYEADDLLGTLARKSWKVIDSVVIVTGDRDILQLVNDKVSVYLPTRGISEGKLMGITDVVEKMGVEPSQIVDLKALTGDSSDNYPGVAGIGPKTAVTLLLKYESFLGIYKNIDYVNPKIAEKLKKGEKMGKISYDLAQIETNAPIEFDLANLDDWSLSRPQISEVFSNIGFKTLKVRVEKMAKEKSKENQLNLL